ncbi:hypothetical protein ACTNCI_07355 [Mitsuokella jalaludinii]|uniref:hypothetical protein n=1 Tax=Mitsuokella jalaludinii TaxID=187979 RepID=UPI003F8B97D2
MDGGLELVGIDGGAIHELLECIHPVMRLRIGLVFLFHERNVLAILQNQVAGASEFLDVLAREDVEHVVGIRPVAMCPSGLTDVVKAMKSSGRLA